MIFFTNLFQAYLFLLPFFHMYFFNFSFIEPLLSSIHQNKINKTSIVLNKSLNHEFKSSVQKESFLLHSKEIDTKNGYDNIDNNNNQALNGMNKRGKVLSDQYFSTLSSIKQSKVSKFSSMYEKKHSNTILNEVLIEGKEFVFSEIPNGKINKNKNDLTISDDIESISRPGSTSTSTSTSTLGSYMIKIDDDDDDDDDDDCYDDDDDYKENSAKKKNDATNYVDENETNSGVIKNDVIEDDKKNTKMAKILIKNKNNNKDILQTKEMQKNGMKNQLNQRDERTKKNFKETEKKKKKTNRKSKKIKNSLKSENDDEVRNGYKIAYDKINNDQYIIDNFSKIDQENFAKLDQKLRLLVLEALLKEQEQNIENNVSDNNI